MKKKEIIKESKDFTKIIKTGKKLKNNYYSIYYTPGEEINKYGITIPTKTGNAVTRNKIKRQIKSIIDKNYIQSCYNYVIIIRKEINSITFEERQKELLKLFNKLGAEK